MLKSHPGELAALATAVFWTFTALAFTSAGKRIGSLAVNFWRLIVGLALLTAYVSITGGQVVPTEADNHAWLWLSFSGFVGIFLGDLFLFKAFTLTGPRVALLIMSVSPIVAALISWLLMDDILSWSGLAGMAITLTGIVIVVLSRKEKNGSQSKKIRLNYDPRGVMFAVLGAIGQATGIVMSKVGLQTIENPFAGTQIRLYSGLLGFILLITWLRRWKPVMFSVKDKVAFGTLSVGAFFGPFLGISFSLIAVKYTNPGIVQTIASLTPVLIIPFSIFVNKEKIGIRDLLGALIAVGGVTLFFLK
jgi:drug/metabolite transporter (DMT)-like permease